MLDYLPDHVKSRLRFEAWNTAQNTAHKVYQRELARLAIEELSRTAPEGAESQGALAREWLSYLDTLPTTE